MDAGDTVLAEHFKTAPANAKYNSPQIQNDLIACTGEWIRKQILNEVPYVMPSSFLFVQMRLQIVPTKNSYL